MAYHWAVVEDICEKLVFCKCFVVNARRSSSWPPQPPSTSEKSARSLTRPNAWSEATRCRENPGKGSTRDRAVRSRWVAAKGLRVPKDWKADDELGPGSRSSTKATYLEGSTSEWHSHPPFDRVMIWPTGMTGIQEKEPWADRINPESDIKQVASRYRARASRGCSLNRLRHLRHPISAWCEKAVNEKLFQALTKEKEDLQWTLEVLSTAAETDKKARAAAEQTTRHQRAELEAVIERLNKSREDAQRVMSARCEALEGDSKRLNKASALMDKVTELQHQEDALQRSVKEVERVKTEREALLKDQDTAVKGLATIHKYRLAEKTKYEEEVNLLKVKIGHMTEVTLVRRIGGGKLTMHFSRSKKTIRLFGLEKATLRDADRQSGFTQRSVDTADTARLQNELASIRAKYVDLVAVRDALASRLSATMPRTPGFTYRDNEVRSFLGYSESESNLWMDVAFQRQGRARGGSSLLSAIHAISNPLDTAGVPLSVAGYGQKGTYPPPWTDAVVRPRRGSCHPYHPTHEYLPYLDKWTTPSSLHRDVGREFDLFVSNQNFVYYVGIYKLHSIRNARSTIPPDVSAAAIARAADAPHDNKIAECFPDGKIEVECFGCNHSTSASSDLGIANRIDCKSSVASGASLATPGAPASCRLSISRQTKARDRLQTSIHRVGPASAFYGLRDVHKHAWKTHIAELSRAVRILRDYPQS
ncbi:hypothetical protein FB45DRAFT_869232 [Roridomyces roridus]|uniref:Uncharacterized protein n=1 Tax=Roridomyces roridus TaxID=1738132 RepID=A0AAD7BNR7_9AGAR|nr:hypothetical protein FB45DRAFT_869232 [Roridomyces roridus]